MTNAPEGPAGGAERPWQRPNIYDVARNAGVSHMTVSRVVNGHANIRPATKERVLHAIEELRFAPNSIARALATRRAMRIGVLVDAPLQYGPNATLRALESAARDAGYSLEPFSVSDAGDTDFDAGLLDLTRQGVDALCVIAARVASLEALRGRAVDVPTVVITTERDQAMLTVAVDQRAGALLATRHLLDLGHRSIAHVSGPLDWYDALAREAGWRQALVHARVPAGSFVIGDWTAECGYRIGSTHDFSGDTAIFAANDQMALGLVHGLTERGVRVPDELSVVGYDDLPDARHFMPPLTTVRQDFRALGTRAIEALVGAIHEGQAVRHQMIEPTLIIRGSTAASRSAGEAGTSAGGAGSLR